MPLMFNKSRKNFSAQSAGFDMQKLSPYQSNSATDVLIITIFVKQQELATLLPVRMLDQTPNAQVPNTQPFRDCPFTEDI